LIAAIAASSPGERVSATQQASPTPTPTPCSALIVPAAVGGQAQGRRRRGRRVSPSHFRG
jgi:hypothetical protein